MQSIETPAMTTPEEQRVREAITRLAEYEGFCPEVLKRKLDELDEALEARRGKAKQPAPSRG